jgi:hypothetical protein
MSRDWKVVMESDAALSQALRRLPRAAAPAGLTTRLRVVASRERHRRLRRRHWSAWVREWVEGARLAFDNVMRPLAVPVAGGVFSAVTLFNIWVVPAYPAAAQMAGKVDVPTKLTTAAQVKGFSLVSSGVGDIVVDILLDDRGRMVDYVIVNEDALSPAARRNLENMLVFSTFVPATSFGRPVAGKMRLWVSSSRIDVKG